MFWCSSQFEPAFHLFFLAAQDLHPSFRQHLHTPEKYTHIPPPVFLQWSCSEWIWRQLTRPAQPANRMNARLTWKNLSYFWLVRGSSNWSAFRSETLCEVRLHLFVMNWAWTPASSTKRGVIILRDSNMTFTGDTWWEKGNTLKKLISEFIQWLTYACTQNVGSVVAWHNICI